MPSARSSWLSKSSAGVDSVGSGAGRMNVGDRRIARKSPPILPTGRLARAGTSTSSMTWVRKVALASSSTSRNREADCGMIFPSATRRCIRQGEKASSTGSANKNRQGVVASHRRQAAVAGGRRPMTWSRRSIAFKSGSRCWADQRWVDVVMSTIGWFPPAKPSSRARSQPFVSGRTTNASAWRFRALSRSSNP